MGDGGRSLPRRKLEVRHPAASQTEQDADVGAVGSDDVAIQCEVFCAEVAHGESPG
jgi:hypothetical protein